MFVLLTTVALLSVTTYMISKKFGYWAGLVVSGVHIVNILVDYFVVGDLTTFRQIFYSIYAFLLIVAFYKTIKKLGL